MFFFYCIGDTQYTNQKRRKKSFSVESISKVDRSSRCIALLNPEANFFSTCTNYNNLKFPAFHLSQATRGLQYADLHILRSFVAKKIRLATNGLFCTGKYDGMRLSTV